MEENQMTYQVPLLFQPQPEGGFTVTSPVLPELDTEGDTIQQALANVDDALASVLETYHDLGRSLPSAVQVAEGVPRENPPQERSFARPRHSTDPDEGPHGKVK